MRSERKFRIAFVTKRIFVILGILCLMLSVSHLDGRNLSFAASTGTAERYSPDMTVGEDCRHQSKAPEESLGVDQSPPANRQGNMTSESGSDVGSPEQQPRAVLEKCWTPLELEGNKTDKRIERLRHPDLSPPRHTRPYDIGRPVLEGMRKSIRLVDLDDGHKYIALTFDLCERANEKAGYDADIVNYLRKSKIKATFFAGGKWMATHPDKTMQLMAEPLFELGSHAWTHGNMRVLNADEMDEQILWTQAQYEILREELIKKASGCKVDPAESEKIPKRMQLFRFPYGTCKPEALDKLAGYGLMAIQWDVVTGDASKKQNADGIVKTVLAQVKPGSIIIAHANGRGHGTAEALPLFIPELIKRGYRFVTVSELLAMGPVVATQECYELKLGDNQRYDRIFGKGTGAK